jgi:L-lactate dehydrogenase
MTLSHRSAFTVGIVGCGKVGMTAAYALLLQGVPTHLILHGRDRAKVEGEKLDLEHGLPFLSECDITATDDFADLQTCDVILFTAGAAQEPGETRLDLATKNMALLDDLIPKINHHAPTAVLVMVTNPVDVLTYHAAKLCGDFSGRIFGTGTILDTARLRWTLSQSLDVNPRSIHTYLLGEHGDSSFPTYSNATIGGQDLKTFPGFTTELGQKAYEAAKNAAYKVIEGKGATYYAIGTVVSHLLKGIQKDSRSVLPVSVPLNGEFGLHDVALSVPCIVGRRGAQQVLKITLDREETILLQKSAEQLRR